MIKLWKWLLRPLVIAVSGVSGAKTVEENPRAGCIFLVLSIISVLFLLRDVYIWLQTSGIIAWLSGRFS